MISPEDFLNIASELLKEGEKRSEEIYLRSSISRAYYYIFHTIRESYKRINPNYFSYDYKDHKKCYDLLERYDVYLKNLFRDLRAKRNSTDYDLYKDITISEAKEYLEMVTHFVEKFRSLKFFNHHQR